ncbi:dicarboxylate/amino acid:cation symporter [Dysosmobacter sp. NSJ-60]|uniref:Sodium:dicarboxylate symporter n=1 Tax=Pusillibacter faecalis TaxID=2714358 RepID=A0A810QIA1_9FIRM|nr:dicarboxylate/amino acid:cation symporter [Pusillibacter faecalis]MBC5748062.1 dicarboxylate/amino acid:cation symporter [Dysosmobacter hominis]MBS5658740.1 dicarboxylate/amino acid:cation symporter [Oscillibacter sp.]MCQ5026079.1 dicarboxylate/amino acid:cation symporter [Oscillibacter valericigenes]BCK85576.1 sodium:dicarboxylate symporter [Pusillibacter faecalis]
MERTSVKRNYVFLAIMLGAMVAGAAVGWFFPVVKDADGTVLEAGATIFKPLGTVFINLMFCIVVPMVFASISSAVANMKSRRRAGKIMGVTVATFVVTGAIAAVIMFVLMRLFPPVLTPWTEFQTGEMGDYASLSELIVNFFTAEDFVGLLSRQAMLPLIVFSLLFGFAVNLTGGGETLVGKFLDNLAEVMLKFVQLVTYYAPIAFFGFFADLVATYGSQIVENYVRALAVYYPLCFLYIFTAWPLFAWFGGGKGAVKTMFAHIAKPAIVSLGTCSSVATIPTNMEAAADTGISKDVTDMVLPLGATMHMDGSCFSCVLKIAFVFGVFGQPFTFSQLVPVVLVAVLSSVGMSGVPGGGYIGEYIICSIFFADHMEIAFPILVTIGNLVDPPATMINSAGDYVASFLVSRFVDGKNWLQRAGRQL